MKIAYLVLMACFLSGCYMFDANLPRPKAEYGQSGEHTIAVMAGIGFRKPGVHHVPRGTTLRAFIARAEILPETRRFPLIDYHVHQIRDGKGVGFRANEPSENQWEARLEDGAIVEVFKCNI